MSKNRKNSSFSVLNKIPMHNNANLHIYLQVVLYLIFMVMASCESDKDNPISPAVIMEEHAISDLTSTSVVCHGIVNSDGGSVILEKGVCWVENITGSGTPTVSDNKTMSIETAGTGPFTCTIQELKPYTGYWARFYAINAMGTRYSREFGFMTLQESK
jgi:hypothetical protein